MNSTKAIRDRLTSRPSITNRLDVWKSAPAIFSGRAPDEYLVQQAKFCAVIPAPTRDESESTLTETIRGVTQDVRFYGKDTGTSATLDDLARDARDLFDARPADITLAGGKCTLAAATGPVEAPTTDPSLIGRRITLRLQLTKD